MPDTSLKLCGSVDTEAVSWRSDLELASCGSYRSPLLAKLGPKGDAGAAAFDVPSDVMAFPNPVLDGPGDAL